MTPCPPAQALERRHAPEMERISTAALVRGATITVAAMVLFGILSYAPS